MKLDLIIIGTGPAGMAAAVEAEKLSLKCLVIDEQPRSGGQIYRNIAKQPVAVANILGTDYQKGLSLVADFNSLSCKKITQATVWNVTAGGKVYYSVGGESFSVSAKKVMVATGAQERPMPIPGWTIPGVMTAGSAQVLLKSSGIAADGAVFAGNGPLLYLVVWQYLQAGIKVKAVLETTERLNYIRALKYWLGAFKGYKNLVKGLLLLASIKKARIPVYKNVSHIEAKADAEGNLSQVLFSQGLVSQGPATSSEREQVLETDHLFLHQGVIPQVNLPMASGCKYHWHELYLCWMPLVDEWGQSSQENIFICGDGQGVGGAISAKYRGQLAAHQIAEQCGLLQAVDKVKATRFIRKKLANELAFRPFIETLYRPADQFRVPVEEKTIVCRCEEIRLQDIKQAVNKGCLGPNQLKTYTRCGMGPCQGRQCGNTVSELLAKINNTTVNNTGYYRLRAPIKPLNLAELASLKDED